MNIRAALPSSLKAPFLGKAVFWQIKGNGVSQAPTSPCTGDTDIKERKLTYSCEFFLYAYVCVCLCMILLPQWKNPNTPGVDSIILFSHII